MAEQNILKQTTKESITRYIIIVILFALLLIFPGPLYAQNTNLTNGIILPQNTGLPTTDLITMLGRLIRVFVSFMGLVLVLMIMYSGLKWMFAGGDETKTAAARRTLVNAIIGLVLIFSAYAISAFVFNALRASGV